MFKLRATEDFLHLEFFAPESANAFGLEAARELRKIQKANRKWNKPVLVSSAHERMFCSGGHLADYQKLKTKAAGLKVNREITRILQEFATWNAPKLALIEGDVLGGGVEWLGAFDYRWSTPHALLAFWQRRIALSTGWGGGARWAKKIGEENVRKLLVEARLLGADEALRLGLLDQVLAPWRIREEAEAWAIKFNRLEAEKTHRWSALKESAIFASLWMAPEHRSHLQRWKKRP